MSKMLDVEEEIEPNVEMDIEEVEEKIEKIPKKKGDIFEKRQETEEGEPIVEPIVEPIIEKKEKKKRPLSDKQKAHLERMRKIKLEKNNKTKLEGKPIKNKKKIKEVTTQPDPLHNNNNFMDSIADHIFNRLDKKLVARQQQLTQQSQLQELQRKKINQTRTKPIPIQRATASRQHIKPQYDPYDDCFS